MAENQLTGGVAAAAAASWLCQAVTEHLSGAGVNYRTQASTLRLDDPAPG